MQKLNKSQYHKSLLLIIEIHLKFNYSFRNFVKTINFIQSYQTLIEYKCDILILINKIQN